MTRDPANSTAEGDLALFGLLEESDGWLASLREAHAAEVIGTIGPYELQHELGRGGQGVVFRATHVRTGETVAIKRLHPREDGSGMDRAQFRREIEAVSRMNHPSIAALRDSLVTDGHACVVMSLIEGRPIHEHCGPLRESADGLREIARLGAETADALHHAHQRGVIHRDIKPSNVLIEVRDGTTRPVLLDFGIAHLQHDTIDRADLTITQRLGLTPTYASPEQVLGSDDPDIRTDIYSLAVVLFRCATGRLPYPSDDTNLLRTLEHIRTTRPAKPSSHNHLIPKDLDAILLKALSKAPADRYQSMEVFAADLRAFFEGLPVSASAPSFRRTVRRAARQHKAASAMFVALVLTICAATAVSSVMAVRATRSAREESRARLAANELNRVLQESLGSAIASRTGRSATLLEALAEVALRAETELSAHPEYAADLLLTIGTTYRSLWLYEDSIPPLRRALALYESLPDEPDLKVARTLSVLGTALTSVRDEQAVPIQERALRIRREQLGDDHPDTLQSMVKLGYALHQAAKEPDLDRAHELMLAALASYRRIYTEPHRETGSCLHNLAYLTLKLRQQDRSRALYRESIREFREAGATDDHYYAEVLHSFSGIIAREETAQECIDLLDEAIPLVERIFGDERARRLYGHRVRMLLALGRAGDAADAFETHALLTVRALEDARSIDRDTADVLTSTIRAFGGTSPRSVQAMIDTLASLEGPQKKPLLTDASLACRIQIRAGEHERATQIAQAMLDQRLTVAPDARDGDAINAIELFAEIDSSRGNHESAEAHFRRALELDNNVRRTFRTNQLRVKFGRCLTALGKYEEAERHIALAYESERDAWGSEDLDAQKGLKALIELYEVSDRSDEAEALRPLVIVSEPRIEK